MVLNTHDEVCVTVAIEVSGRALMVKVEESWGASGFRTRKAMRGCGVR